MEKENKFKCMATCKVCGRDFPLIAEEHYVSKEAEKIGLAAIAGGPAPVLFDSFDCPHCGCQNNMQQRNRLTDIMGRNLPIDEEYDDDDDDPVCPYPKGGECYCKDSCDSSCEFHKDYKREENE